MIAKSYRLSFDISCNNAFTGRSSTKRLSVLLDSFPSEDQLVDIVADAVKSYIQPFDIGCVYISNRRILKELGEPDDMKWHKNGVIYLYGDITGVHQFSDRVNKRVDDLRSLDVT